MFLRKVNLAVLSVAVTLSGSMVAQSKAAARPAAKTASKSKADVQAPAAAPTDPKQKFALDVIKTAVSLPQTDNQDRLRVLRSAADVALPIAPKLAEQYAREGVKIESELIRVGETPAVSIMANSKVDCGTAANFIRALTPESVARAEQSILGAISTCPKQATDPARNLLDTALDQRVLAPRALMALIDSGSVPAQWAESRFVKLFDSLPSDANANVKEAPNFATMYATTAPKMSKDAAKTAGVKLLAWLGKLDPSGTRNLAVNIATDGMKQVLGDEAYQQAISSDVMVQQVAATAGQPGEAEHEEEETASVQDAMADNGTDKSDSMRDLPASLRAREAAAHGFASGTDGDKQAAGKYFDMAFSAANDVWSNRTPDKDAAAVIEEISEAAAQVNATDALQRAQRLNDPAAQAISMLAVARVVGAAQ